MASYRMQVIEIDGELALDFPDELLDAMDWKAGDTLVWTYRTTGVWELSKQKDLEKQDVE